MNLQIYALINEKKKKIQEFRTETWQLTYIPKNYISRSFMVYGITCIAVVNPKNSRYNFYRHIKICDKWAKFSGFYEDMYPSYKQSCLLIGSITTATIVKKTGRWATAIEQARNTRNVERAKGLNSVVKRRPLGSGLKNTALIERP